TRTAPSCPARAGCAAPASSPPTSAPAWPCCWPRSAPKARPRSTTPTRSSAEEHASEIQSHLNVVCPPPLERENAETWHEALVAAPRRLRGARAVSPDIRAGIAMLLAALCAEGTSKIDNADQIERGHERIDERLNALGAKITRVPERGR